MANMANNDGHDIDIVTMDALFMWACEIELSTLCRLGLMLVM